jgi:hypothetical protein
MIRDSVALLKACGREVLYDAEHFFDGFKDDADYALETVLAAARSGADAIILCDTNGGTLPFDIEDRRPGAQGLWRARGHRARWASTPTTTAAWRWPTALRRRAKPAPPLFKAPSTGTANGAAMPT